MRKFWGVVISYVISYRKVYLYVFFYLEINKVIEKKNKVDCLNVENGLCEFGRGVLRTGMMVEEGRGDLIRGWF